MLCGINCIPVPHYPGRSRAAWWFTEYCVPADPGPTPGYTLDVGKYKITKSQGNVYLWPTCPGL